MSLTDALAAKIAALRAGGQIDWRVVVSVTDFVDRVLDHAEDVIGRHRTNDSGDGWCWVCPRPWPCAEIASVARMLGVNPGGTDE